jgi:hypothetical protein
VDCNGTEQEHHRGFYFHNGEDQNSIMEGLTITNGFHRTGAGVSCNGSSPTIRNNIITCNQIGFDWDGGAGIACRGGASPTIANNIISDNHCAPGLGGGGIVCYDAGSPTIVNNLISHNTASSGGGIEIHNGNFTISDCTFSANTANVMAGGLLCSYNSNIILNNCTFTNNSASQGGGIWNSESDITLFDCGFMGNRARYTGGGMYGTRSSTISLANCIFAGNRAGEHGGAMYNHGYQGGLRATLTNCTFTGNLAPDGNAVGYDSYLQEYPSALELTNCILWDRGNEIWNNDGSGIAVAYSDVQAGWPGPGNIDADPCFASPGYWAEVNDPNTAVEPNDPNVLWIDGDHHLKSEAGRWDPNSKSWVLDGVTSPCVDGGDPNSPVGDEPPPNGWVINMGAYGGTEQASKSTKLTCWDAAACAGQTHADATCDGTIDVADLFALKTAFGRCAPWVDPECCRDYNHDGFVNLADLFILKANYGTTGLSPSTGNQDCPP